MALTLTTTDYNKVVGTQTDSVIRATSTLWNSYADFNYVVDISPLGFSFNGNTQLRFYVKPRPSDGLMLFNLSEAMKNIPMLQTYDYTASTYIHTSALSGRRIILTVSEYYNGLIQSTSAQQFFDIIYSAYSKTPIIKAFPSTFGVDTIGNKYFNIGHNMYWRYHKRYSANIDNVKYYIEIYDNNGALAYTLNNAVSLKAMAISSGQNFPIAVETLDNYYLQNTSLIQFKDMIIINRKFFKVYDVIGTAPSQSINMSAQLNIINQCGNDKGVMLYFLNEYGQWEHFYFPHWKESMTAVRKSYEIDKYDRDGNIRTNYDFELLNSSIGNTTLTIRTDMLYDDVDFKLLKRVITSPYHYLNFVEDTNNTLYAVMLADNRYNVMRQFYDKIQQITFNFKFDRQINL